MTLFKEGKDFLPCTLTLKFIVYNLMWSISSSRLLFLQKEAKTLKYHSLTTLIK